MGGEPSVDPQGREPSALGELLAGITRRRRWEGRLRAAAVFRRWKEVVGDVAARRCEPVRVAGGTLLVRAETAAWATELGYLEGEIVARCDALLGPGVVTGVRIVVGALEGTAEKPEPGDSKGP